MGNDVRTAALNALDDMDINGAYSGAAIERQRRRTTLDGKDTAFLHELVYGVIKRRISLDYIIFQYSKIKRSRISVTILNILRMGAYQMVFLDKVPVSAACNEGVKLAAKFGNAGSKAFVNAILRKIAADKRPWGSEWLTGQKPGTPEYLSILHSYPKWLCERWLPRYGSDFTEELLAAGNRRPELTIRVNTLRTTVAELRAGLEAENFRVRPGHYAEAALLIENPGDFSGSALFAQGLFTVQDESSMLAAAALAPEAGTRILDMCAAPGGKCGYLAELTRDDAHIEAWDLYPHKIKLVEQNNERLGIKSIAVSLRDARVYEESLKESFDAVLVDAPCTGLGIIRKKPEIKWTKSQQDIDEVCAIQKEILDNAAVYLKKDGVLLYSVCTTEPEEGEQMIAAFLASHREFSPEPIEDGRHELRLFPNCHEVDGFYMAKLRKTEAG